VAVLGMQARDTVVVSAVIAAVDPVPVGAVVVVV
jgi:hypothetical protein